MKVTKGIIIILMVCITSLVCSCNKSEKSIIIPANTANKEDSKSKPDNKPYKELYSLAEKHLKAAQLSYDEKNVERIVEIIKKNDKKLIDVNKQLNIPKELIQSIILREQLFIGLDDSISDSAVQNYYSGLNNKTDNAQFPTNGIDDSSTGLGQIFARTAIYAEKTVNSNTKLNPNNKLDVGKIWFELQDDETNIYYIGLVLKLKASEKGVELSTANKSTIESILSRYNGSGPEATLYGQQTMEYYEVLKKYNVLK